MNDSTPSASQVKLRVCDGEAERILAASVEALEREFASPKALRAGTEISLIAGDRTLVALALGKSDKIGDTGEFLLSSIYNVHAALSGPVRRREALRQFREFITDDADEALADGRRGR